MDIDKFNSLKVKWLAFQDENPKVRIRDAAKKIGVSEAELLSTEIDDSASFLSIISLKDFIKDILLIDKVMFLIRNDIVVHEKIVRSKDVELIDNQIIFIKNNNSILLDFNKQLFKYAFFQKKLHANKELRSFQFFDASGHSILKIYLKGKDSLQFDNIALKYKSKYNYELQSELHLEFSAVGATDIAPDLPFSINKSKSVARNMPSNSLRLILENASSSKIPIQIHGFGLGAVQYHRDIVRNIVDYGPWINVIDRDFNLHVLEQGLSKAVLNQYDFEGKQYSLIDFFDKNNSHVLGISAVKEYENDFLSIINKIKEN